MDLTTQDPEGRPWNFSDPKQRNRAKQHIIDSKPDLIIGSPMCRMFSRLMNLNRAKMGPERFDRAMKEARDHLNFCLEIYDIQERAGRYYLHEHPARATSWDLPEVRSFIMNHDAHLVTMDMCRYGMCLDGKAVRNRQGG